jgi:hypothetical protein
MTTLAVKIDLPYADSVMTTEDTLNVDPSAGRTISVSRFKLNMQGCSNFILVSQDPVSSLTDDILTISR